MYLPLAPDIYSSYPRRGLLSTARYTPLPREHRAQILVLTLRLSEHMLTFCYLLFSAYYARTSDLTHCGMGLFGFYALFALFSFLRSAYRATARASPVVRFRLRAEYTFAPENHSNKLTYGPTCWYICTRYIEGSLS